MNAKELMIGDWVMDTEPTFYTRVTAGMIYEGYDWEPMPLTEEVLMANGFYQSEPYSRIWLMKGNSHIQLYIGEKAILYYSIELDYVHKLQQLLRLMGKYDLADNFKIKP